MGQSSSPSANGAFVSAVHAGNAGHGVSGDAEPVGTGDGPGDRFDLPAVGWESLWIDVGGEG
jgi:hypothetical protein